MVTLEQVEKLREKANISYDEAKATLEKTNGDILEAIILLERENRIPAPEGGGYYSSKGEQQTFKDSRQDKKFKGESRKDDSASFRELLGRFFRWCGKILEKGNRNSFEVKKDGEKIITVPVTVLAVLLIFTFWITVPLIIIGLFFGCRYMFSGPDLGKENVNHALNSVSKVAENIKKEVKDCINEKSKREDPDNRR
jgi:hypothetical protein